MIRPQSRPCHSIHCRHYDLADGRKCEIQALRETYRAESCGRHFPEPCPPRCFICGDRFSQRQIDYQVAR